MSWVRVGNVDREVSLPPPWRVWGVGVGLRLGIFRVLVGRLYGWVSVGEWVGSWVVGRVVYRGCGSLHCYTAFG